ARDPRGTRVVDARSLAGGPAAWGGHRDQLDRPARRLADDVLALPRDGVGHLGRGGPALRRPGGDARGHGDVPAGRPGRYPPPLKLGLRLYSRLPGPNQGRPWTPFPT